MRPIKASDRTSDAMYLRVFEQHAEGTLILEELIERYNRNPYIPGGLEAQRETDFKAGQMQVVTYILNRIARAQTGEHDDE